MKNTLFTALIIAFSTIVSFFWIECRFWVALIGIVFSATCLLGLYFSLIFKGIGENRTALFIITISIVGISTIILNFSMIYSVLGIFDSTNNATTSLVDTNYFSVITWTTVGYGDFRPSESARPFVMIEALLGYVLMALQISALVATVQKK